MNYVLSMVLNSTTWWASWTFPSFYISPSIYSLFYNGFFLNLHAQTTEKAIIRKEKHLEEDAVPDGDDEEVIYKIEVPANRSVDVSATVAFYYPLSFSIVTIFECYSISLGLWIWSRVPFFPFNCQRGSQFVTSWLSSKQSLIIHLRSPRLLSNKQRDDILKGKKDKTEWKRKHESDFRLISCKVKYVTPCGYMFTLFFIAIGQLIESQYGCPFECVLLFLVQRWISLKPKKKTAGCFRD